MSDASHRWEAILNQSKYHHVESSGNLAVFERPIIPLLVMAVIAIALLVAAHVLWLNSGATRTTQRVR